VTFSFRFERYGNVDLLRDVTGQKPDGPKPVTRRIAQTTYRNHGHHHSRGDQRLVVAGRELIMSKQGGLGQTVLRRVGSTISGDVSAMELRPACR